MGIVIGISHFPCVTVVDHRAEVEHARDPCFAPGPRLHCVVLRNPLRSHAACCDLLTPGWEGKAAEANTDKVV